MKNWLRKAEARLAVEVGAVSAEYALLLVMIAVVVLVGAAALGIAVRNKFSEVADCIAADPSFCPNTVP